MSDRWTDAMDIGICHEVVDGWFDDALEGTEQRPHSTQAAYVDGCGSLSVVAGASAVEIYTYVAGVSPRVAWNEIWVMPLEGRVCIELSHAKES